MGICIHSAVYQMGEVKGPAVELADFTDTPYKKGLDKVSEECVFDLNFDGQDDIFWFDQNYPPDKSGALPFVVGFEIGGQMARLDSIDVKELHSFVLADLNTNDQCCDLIISMTRGADQARKTLVVGIPRKETVFPLALSRLSSYGSPYLKANCWSLGESGSKTPRGCLIDGLYQGISEEGELLIGDFRLKPGRNYTLEELEAEETA